MAVFNLSPVVLRNTSLGFFSSNLPKGGSCDQFKLLQQLIFLASTVKVLQIMRNCVLHC